MEAINNNEFNLKQDWNWNKIIHKADEWVNQNAYENAHNTLMDFLEISDESELTKEHEGELNELIKYLEAPYDKGGLGYDINEAPFSVNYYAFYCVIRDWGDEEMFGESE